MEFRYKEVYFDGYCAKCKHRKRDEAESPCDECLKHAVNDFSHKPIMFESKEDE